MQDSEDQRQVIYQQLHRDQIHRQQDENSRSAGLILAELFRHYLPKSVLDVGSGIGTWLAVAQQLGVLDVMGIEGHWLDKSLAQIPQHLIVEVDLEQPFDLGRRFDLLICLEVAEHLSPAAAMSFVASLTRHADVILFSAAIPFQGGHHHVNEQFLDYWSRIFNDMGYKPVDFLRALFWDNPSVLWWLRQNIVVFTHNELATGSGRFAALAEANGPLSIVHPNVYLDRVKASPAIIEEHLQLIALLSSGTTFSVGRQPNGQLTITKLS